MAGEVLSHVLTNSLWLIFYKLRD